jgi:hypothetical protein
VDCGHYRELYEQFMSFPLPPEVWNSAEYRTWQAHGLACRVCGEWDLLMRVQRRGVDLATFPCVHVAYHSTSRCDVHADTWECPDTTLVRTTDGFGIPVRDGGTSMIRIQFCPWCGISLSGPKTAEPGAAGGPDESR